MAEPVSNVDAPRSLEYFRNVITTAFPRLAHARYRLHSMGWHCAAVDVDDRLIFKFPRNETAERALRKEAGLLSAIRPRISMNVPDLTLHEGSPLFSWHPKIAGEHLLTEHYAELPEAACQRLAQQMACFYAELHALDPGQMETSGAEPIEPWLASERILQKALPALPVDMWSYVERTIAGFDALPPDPYGMVYGFFDGHGWNMAFDYQTGKLNGIYDFADSGFGSLHQEFIYSNLISSDLTARIVDEYETLTGRALDRHRINVLTSVHRLSELAELADDPVHAPAMAEAVLAWARCSAS